MVFGEKDPYHRPLICEKCGGIMIFKGVGEYHCESCGYVAYDDYGKVRLYIEQHARATAFEVEANTGVAQKTIRQMLKENRLEIAPDSSTFLKCEMCGVSIRSGTFCPKCEKLYQEKVEEEQRKLNKMQGYGKKQREEEGAKRFERRR